MTIKKDWFVSVTTPDLNEQFTIKGRIFSARTKYQSVEIIDTYTFGRCLILDDKIQSSELDEFIYHEALVHPAMIMHAQPHKVFVAGGGEGAVLREVLKYTSVNKVIMVDIDGEVIKISDEFLPSWHQNAFRDPRVKLIFDDARRYLAETNERFDVIICDLSDPISAGPSRFLFTREFYTKYDYSSYNYLHQTHGTFGSTYGVWGYFPSNESLVGGPTKQNLIYTGNLLILEAYSNHYDNELALTTPAGTASSRLFGPFYIHFNTIGKAYNATGSPINTPGDMYADTLEAGASFIPLYDTEEQLLLSGYIPSTARGSVSIQVNGVVGAPKTAWAVLSDPAKNIQLSSHGYQYWADISATG
ncbi:MAG: hypothetical protein ABSA33_05635, partial [Candidatus Micrarchaeaceae archaeon]